MYSRTPSLVRVVGIGVLASLIALPIWFSTGALRPAIADSSPSRPPDSTGTVAPLPEHAATQTMSDAVTARSRIVGQPLHVFDPSWFSAAKQQANAQERAAEAARRKPVGGNSNGAYAAISPPGTNQLGLTFTDNSTCGQTYCSPSDSTGSIGPNNYVEMVNERVAVYNRDLTLATSTMDVGAFAYNNQIPQGQSNVVSDVQVEWDQAANRWLYALITNNATPLNYATHNYILWGWSKTGDPTNLNTGWCKYSKDMGTELEDFPKLGHDASSLVVGANALDESTGGTFLTAKVWVVKLPANGVSTCPTIGYVTFGTTRSPLLDGDGQTKTFTPVPTNTTDSGANDYIISAYPLSQAHPNQATLTAFHVVYKNGSANSLYRDGDLNVSPFSLPPDIPQPGTSYVLDSLDGRITQAVARYDPDAGATAIWTTHTIREPGGPAFAEVRWYELLPATRATRQQADVLNNGPNTFNGSISSTTAGNEAVLFYNVGDGSNLANIEASSRIGTTPLSTLDLVPITIASSSVPDTDPTCSNSQFLCRWGDYSGASPDPSNAHVVWGTSQTTGTGGTSTTAGWYTYNFAVSTVSTPTCATVTVTAGEGHALAIDTSGYVWAWGLGSSSQLGNNSTMNQTTPVQVLGVGGVGFFGNAHSIAAAQSWSVAVTNPGAVYYWGTPTVGAPAAVPTPVPDPSDPTGFMTGVKQVVAGWRHAVALKGDGSVWDWGDNSYGQLGIPITTPSSATPIHVSLPGTVVSIAAGHDHSMALLSDGTVWAWGDNEFAQLGQNTAGPGNYSSTPLEVKGPGGVGHLAAVTGIAGGTEAGGSLAISSDQTLWAWGTASPTSSWTPAQVTDPSNDRGGKFEPVAAAISGFNHRLARKVDGSMWAYGPDNTYGQLGTGDNAVYTTPQAVRGTSDTGQLSGVVALAAGMNFSLALGSNGSIYSWGDNGSGELGDGSNVNQNFPATVGGLIAAQPSIC